MKSWGAILITATGFVVGVVLAGVGGLSAKTRFFPVMAVDASKKIEKYWAETGLGQNELFSLISNSNCQSSEKYFLACINSVTENLADEHKTLSVENGEIENVTKSNYLDDELTEKERLQEYTQMYSRQQNLRINFERIWLQMIEDEKPESRASLMANGINSFLSVYKDPHTYILPENYYEEVGSQLERSPVFVGISFEKVKSKTLVRKIFKNSDAQQAGLQPFDQVLKINDQEARELSLLDISQMLKDPETKEFDFKILRQNKIQNILVKRRFQHLSHVQFEILSGLVKNVAVVTITKFNRGVCEEVALRIKSAAEKNISGLILDLRDNPGGQLDEAACLAGLFLGMNKRTYSVEFFDPLKSSEVVLSTGSLLYTGPLVVLTNSSSASASELLAGALQDYRRALIVGEKTFGKGTFQESEIWTKNRKITLFKTQGFYLLPSQMSTQFAGIQPDIEFDEGHKKLREENIYFNPIQGLKMLPVEAKAVGFRTGYQDNLKKCLNYSDVLAPQDPLLQKGLQILSCNPITSQLALQYNPNDFN